MRKGLIFQTFVILLLIVAGAGCKFRKIEKSEDWRVKYEAAQEYFEEEDYYKAAVLFEQILPIVRGLPEGENVQFSLAYCQYHQGLYIMASHYFKTFFETYGRSSKVMEARYMYAFSLYADAPETNLDQTSTLEALQAMQNFINKYPSSEFRDDGERIIQELQQKLEIKGFENAMQYYKLEYWEAADVALENFQFEFPDSQLNDDAYLYRILAMFKYAEQSVAYKQPERYGKVKTLYEELIARYPDSELIRQAEKAYEKSLEQLQISANKR